MGSLATPKHLLEQLRRKGIRSPEILQAMAEVPRHDFIPVDLARYAYVDTALAIGEGQTISQPFIVARMTELLLAGGNAHKVLEIGTGSGYQAAILATLGVEVYSIERIHSLYLQAKTRLQNLGFDNIHLHYGDGNEGWIEHAPYDGIMVTAATPRIPKALLQQLASEHGRMIIPVGLSHKTQQLQLIQRKGEDYKTTVLDPVVFVPLISGKI